MQRKFDAYFQPKEREHDKTIDATGMRALSSTTLMETKHNAVTYRHTSVKHGVDVDCTSRIRSRLNTYFSIQLLLNP